MTSEGLGEVFKGDSADMCARKFPISNKINDTVDHIEQAGTEFLGSHGSRYVT